MTPPFKPGDRVMVRYNKPLGVLTVDRCLPKIDKYSYDQTGWYVICRGNGCKFTGPATSLKKVEDDDG